MLNDIDDLRAIYILVNGTIFHPGTSRALFDGDRANDSEFRKHEAAILNRGRDYLWSAYRRNLCVVEPDGFGKGHDRWESRKWNHGWSCWGMSIEADSEALCIAAALRHEREEDRI